MSTAGTPAALTRPWDVEHVKALLRFPRFPVRLIQQEPWKTWLSQRGGLKATYAYLQNYPLSPNHRRILDVVLSNPEAIADVYAIQLNISRATYFYQLRELVPVLVQALNHWDIEAVSGASTLPPSGVPPPALSHLPTPLTSLVGVDSALQTLVQTFLSVDVRLLTLLGPGGIGKTRFSIELARRVCDKFADGFCFVDLTALRDSGFVALAIAQSLGLKDLDEQSDLPLKAHLRAKEFLLVLDNFEHLMPSAPLVAELLAAAPRLKVLVTSRAALHLYGEYEFTIPPLAMPTLDRHQDLTRFVQSPAVALFIQRAQAVNPGFALTPDNAGVIADLCVQMEGIPLAIELMAAQVKYFSPQALMVRISNSKRLFFLSHALKKLPPRQQTLRGMLDWSYMLLTPELQTLFSRLGVFAGGCTIEAAAEIFATSSAPEPDNHPAAPAAHQPSAGFHDPVQAGLTALVDQSLLQQRADSNGEPRFHMLGITREYALERLAARGETSSLHGAHARHYLRLAERLEAQMGEGAQPPAVDLLRSEYANFKAAIQWALENGEGQVGLRFVAALWNFWRRYRFIGEGRQIAQAVLEQTTGLRLSIRAHVHRLAGWLAYDLRDHTTMLRSFQTSLDLCEDLGDRRGVGLSLQGLGVLAQLRGQCAHAREYLHQSLALFDQLDDTAQRAWSSGYLGQLALSQGDLPQAQAAFQESLDSFRSIQSGRGAFFALGQLGQVYLYEGAFEQASLMLEECLVLSRALDETRGPTVGLALNCLAELATQAGQLGRAREMSAACLDLGKAEGYAACVELASCTAGRLAVHKNDHLSAAHYFRESLLLQQLLKEPWRSRLLLEAAASLLVLKGDLLGAARLYGAAGQLGAALALPPLPLYRLRNEESQATLRAQLDPTIFEEAWGAGHSLSMDQAVAYAIRCLE